jgi:hypothetical protein
VQGVLNGGGEGADGLGFVVDRDDDGEHDSISTPLRLPGGRQPNGFPAG